MANMEANKKECMLQINSFNKPLELQGKEAWVQLVTNLMFLRKGTYPSCPDMGIGIQFYEYDFIDDIKDTLQQEINNQVKTYLAGIPVYSIKLDTTLVKNETVLIITIVLWDQTQPNTVVIATTNRKGPDLTELGIKF